VHEVVRAVAARCAHELLRREPGVRDGSDPEDVHKARVATRRTRADLKSIDEVLDPRWSRRVRSELRWFGGLLGEVRDMDVLAGAVTDELEAAGWVDDGGGIVEELAAQRRLRHLELCSAMTSARYHDLIEDLLDAADEPPLAKGVAPGDNGRRLLRRAARRAWRRTERAARRLDDDSTLEELHEVRKRAKRARYAAELATPTFGKPAKRLAKRLVVVQDQLGELNDAATMLTWLDREGPRRLEGGAAYVAGALAERRRRDLVDQRDDWREGWARLTPKRTAWLAG
jgi:CHAD domain-containing protein